MTRRVTRRERNLVRVSIVITLLATLGSSIAAAQTPQPDPADPLYQAKGEQARSYVFPGTDERIPYHIYVPASWSTTARLPLVILTHGANQPATAPFQRPTADPTLARMAGKRGFIVAAVTGYHANATGVGGWNVPYRMVQAPRRDGAGGNRGQGAEPGARAGRGQGGGRGAGAGRAQGGGQAAPTAQDFARAEADVLHVADLMAREYNVDPQRVYLMGNSAGGSAVWNIAAKYPQRWTAIAPSAAPIEDASFPYEALRTVPVLVVHGDADTTMDFAASRVMVEHARARGVDATFLPVPGGAHTDAWALPEILDRTFDFFDAHRTKRN